MANVLFAPSSISALVLYDNQSEDHRIDRLVKVVFFGLSSAKLIFYNVERDSPTSRVLMLDLMATINRYNESYDGNSNLQSVSYR